MSQSVQHLYVEDNGKGWQILVTTGTILGLNFLFTKLFIDSQSRLEVFYTYISFYLI